MIEFRMPSMGADMEAGTLREWLVKPGDMVKRGDIIAVVDTQKGLIDIEVFDTGKIEQLLVKEDQKVPVGTVLALISSEKETPQKQVPVKEVPKAETPSASITPPPTPPPVPQEAFKPVDFPVATEVHARIKASPLARRIAEEKDIDLSLINGTGEEGAITKEDVETFAAAKEGSRKEKTTATTESIRMAVAAAMSRANREIPQYFLEQRIDMSKALAWVAEANKQRTVKQRLLPVVLLIKAVAKALKTVPQLNGYWENTLQQKEQINIGFVVSLRAGGVLIPTLREADKKTLDEIMAWLNDTIPRTRALNLRSSDVTDTTITITNLGEQEAEAVYGVIYPPQVAIVGFGCISEQPWAESGMLDVRPVVKATLAADHRATDAQTGSHFLIAVKNNLQKPEDL